MLLWDVFRRKPFEIPDLPGTIRVLLDERRMAVAAEGAPPVLPPDFHDAETGSGVSASDLISTVVKRANCGRTILSTDKRDGGYLMGLAMHICYVGLPASATLETEAALQLLRLQPFGSLFTDCQLAIEGPRGTDGFVARLEIAAAHRGIKPVARCVRSTADAAIRCAFERAIRVLKVLTARAGRDEEKGQAD